MQAVFGLLAGLLLLAPPSVRAQTVYFLSGPSLDSLAVSRLRLSDRPSAPPERMTEPGVRTFAVSGSALLSTRRPSGRGGMSQALYRTALSGSRREEQIHGRVGSPMVLRPSPDGRVLALDNLYTQRTALWPLAGDSAVRSLPVVAGADARWLPDGSALVLRGITTGRPELGYDLWLAPMSGDSARNLTAAPGDEIGALVSPGGRRIAYAAGRTGAHRVVTMNADGTGRRQRLPTVGTDSLTAGEHMPLLWLDEETLLVRSDRDGPPQLYRLDLVTDALTPMTSLPVPVWEAALSADRTRLAFTAGPLDEERLWLLRLDDLAAPPVPLTPDGWLVRAPVFAP